MSKVKKERVLSSYVITYSQGATINVGNYETRRVSIGISIPFFHGKTAKKALRQAKKFVEKSLEKEIEEIKKKYKTEEVVFGEAHYDIDEIVVNEEV